VVNRTATFVFYLGDKHFGTFTALVPGREAEKYQFTSSLTAQILKNLLPRLQPILFAETLKVTPKPAQEASKVATQAMPSQPEVKKGEGEAKEGTTHEAHPVKKDEQPAGGFPENLDPVLNQTAPVIQPSSPVSPSTAIPAPATNPAK
jgi:hypothetical protein